MVEDHEEEESHQALRGQTVPMGHEVRKNSSEFFKGEGSKDPGHPRCGRYRI